MLIRIIYIRYKVIDACLVEYPSVSVSKTHFRIDERRQMRHIGKLMSI